MEAALRLRLKFEDPSILSKSQRLNGFKRSWILVEPRLRTISDVVSHLLRTFDLSASCPNGILLSMDGFVLPHFETTAILKNEDLVCVKRIRSKLLKVIEECGVKKAVEQNYVEKLQLVPYVPLLANEEFEKGNGCCQSGTEEDEDKLQNDFVHEDSIPNGDVSIKKRKASKPLKNAKRKRQCEDAANSTQKEHVGNSLQNGDFLKSSICNLDEEHKPGDAGKDVSDAKCTTNAVLSGLIKNQEGAVTPFCLPDGTEKVSVTRSTRRKKAKRRWLRSQRLAEKEQIIQKHVHHAEDLNADVACKAQNLDAKDPPNILDEDCEPGDDFVPVVVRPGHIRFAAPGKEKEVEPYEEEEGLFNWQGITNKKKGQKWGMDKQLSSKRNENKSPYRKEQGSKENMDTTPQETHSVCTWDNYTSPEERRSGSKLNDRNICSRNCITQQQLTANASIDYKKLVPLTDIPVRGDTIAYRLLELSSSFCPEMTSYRVGEVLWFDPESNRVMLVPVPEYPFEFKKAVDDTSEELPDTSNYSEDGSLEIDYPSLVDVRIVKRSSDLHPGTSLDHVANGGPSGSNPTSSGSSWRSETRVRSKAPSSQELTTSNNWVGSNTSPAPASENGNKDVWEEISAALSTKKAELLKEDNWNKKTKPANGPRSYRAMRSSALGPTMAWLRAQNGAQTN